MRVGEKRGGDRRVTRGGPVDAGEDVAAPVSVRRERRVGVGGVAEAGSSDRAVVGLTRREHGGLDEGVAAEHHLRADRLQRRGVAGVGRGCGAGDAHHRLRQTAGRSGVAAAVQALGHAVRPGGSTVSGHPARRPWAALARLGGAILPPGRTGAQRGVLRAIDRGEEAVALTVEHRGLVGQLECGREEVLARRVLFEAAHEVADRDVELVGAHDRHVEQDVSDLARHGFDLTLGHPEEHLELHGRAHITLAREQPGVRDVEQVVAGDPDAHHARVLGLQGVVEAAQVVRVRVELRCRRSRATSRA